MENKCIKKYKMDKPLVVNSSIIQFKPLKLIDEAKGKTYWIHAYRKGLTLRGSST